MATTTGELREILVDTIEQLRSGVMKPDVANAICKLAQQANNGFQIEINAMREMRAMGIKAKDVGSNPLGETVASADLKRVK